jgi:hypothetical protein
VGKSIHKRFRRLEEAGGLMTFGDTVARERRINRATR